MATRKKRDVNEPATSGGRIAAVLVSPRATLRRIPAAAWICALVAVLNAAAWSLVTPAFQVPDEQSHYAYSEYLVQHHRPPKQQKQDSLSSNEEAAREGLRADSMHFRPENGTIWSTTEKRELDRLLARYPNRRDGNGAAAEVGGEPMLYYALEAVPYTLAYGGTLFDRLALMRLLSALIGGVTVLLVYLFLREALPSSPWTWTVGALGVAFQPLFAFMTSGVNSDVLLYAASAALFYLLARAFRRGLTQGLALAIGGALAVGLMTKFNAAGLLPGAAIALVVLAARQEKGLRPRTLRLPALALAVALAPMLLEMALNASVWERPVVGATAGNFSTAHVPLSPGEIASYVWQFYFVRLPGTTRALSVGFPFRDLWLNGFIGSFGYVETHFRPRVYDAAIVPFAAVTLLAARALVLRRAIIGHRRLELLCYGTVVAGFMTFVGIASYVLWARTGASVAQTRYLLPLLPLYGAGLALAARGAGPRWMPVAGATIVVLAIAHDVFSQLLVVSRYYA